MSSTAAGRICSGGVADLVPTATLLDTYSGTVLRSRFYDADPLAKAAAGDGNGYSLRTNSEVIGISISLLPPWRCTNVGRQSESDW